MYNKQFLEILFSAKLRAEEAHVNSLSENNPANYLRIVRLNGRIDMLEELIDDLSLAPVEKPTGVTYHTEV